MARNSKYDHSTVVVVADDGSSPVGTNEWNAGHDESGMEGYTESTKTLATGKITPTDSVTIVAAESGTSDDFDLITYSETNANDKLYLFADSGDTITVRHNQTPGAGEAAIITTSASNITLSETVPLILMRRGTSYYQIVENTVGDASTSGTLAQFAATTSAQLAGVISDETGSGALVFGTSPSLTTPDIGTPSAGTLTNCTGLPLTTGVTGVLPSANLDADTAHLSTTQTFTGDKTFTGDVSLSGDLTYTPETITLSTDAIASGGETSIIAAAESGTADDFSSLTGGANDQYKFLYADTGDTITLKHQASPSADQFVLLDEADKTLSETVPTVVVRRGTVWYEWGGGGGGAAGGATATHAFTNQSSTTYRGTGSAGTGIDVGTTVATEATGVGEREIYIRKIDTNNEGVFTVIHKNGSTVEVQIA